MMAGRKPFGEHTQNGSPGNSGRKETSRIEDECTSIKADAPMGPALPADETAEFTKQILEILESRITPPPRTFGFEYEFLPHRRLQPADIENIELFFGHRGFSGKNNELLKDDLGVTFEPGGQIEYQSPPLPPGTGEEFAATLEQIEHYNREINKQLGIEYLATPYIPGRGDTPILLTSPRYLKMHERFARCDRLGHEMMKGTAAIHLHVSLTNIGEIPELYRRLCWMSRNEFKMSAERRRIWDETDSSRCGLPICIEKCCDTAFSLIYGLVGFALRGIELNTGKEFLQSYRALSGQKRFTLFLEHFTTIFTDVRLNLKGATLELRTPDSVPKEEFKEKWVRFTSAF